MAESIQLAEERSLRLERIVAIIGLIAGLAILIIGFLLMLGVINAAHIAIFGIYLALSAVCWFVGDILAVIVFVVVEVIWFGILHYIGWASIWVLTGGRSMIRDPFELTRERSRWYAIAGALTMLLLIFVYRAV